MRELDASSLPVVDEELQAGLIALAHAEQDAAARGFITAHTIERYVHTHGLPDRQIDPGTNHPRPPGEPEFLACDQSKMNWCVRWPNGQVKWQTVDGLRAHYIDVPASPLLGILEEPFK